MSTSLGSVAALARGEAFSDDWPTSHPHGMPKETVALRHSATLIRRYY